MTDANPLSLATLNHSPLHGLPAQLDAHLGAAADAGFAALAPDLFWLRALETEGIGPETLGNRFATAGLGCSEIAGLTVRTTDETVAELAELRRWADALGAEFVNTRIVVEPDSPTVELLSRCGDALAAVGARVALEFSGSIPVDTVSAASRLVSDLDHDGIGVTVDTWHFFVHPAEPDWAGLESIPAHQLSTIQLADGRRIASDDTYARAALHGRCLPGDGEFDLARVLDVIQSKGFIGPVVAEVLDESWRSRSIAEFAGAVSQAYQSVLA